MGAVLAKLLVWAPPGQAELLGAGWWRCWQEQPVHMDLCNVGEKYLQTSNRPSLLWYLEELYH